MVARKRQGKWGLACCKEGFEGKGWRRKGEKPGEGLLAANKVIRKRKDKGGRGLLGAKKVGRGRDGGRTVRSQACLLQIRGRGEVMEVEQ